MKTQKELKDENTKISKIINNLLTRIKNKKNGQNK